MEKWSKVEKDRRLFKFSKMVAIWGVASTEKSVFFGKKSKSVFGNDRRKEVLPTCGVDAEWRQLHKLAYVCERACGLWWACAPAAYPTAVLVATWYPVELVSIISV